MERSMEAREAMRDETVAERENEQAMRVLPAAEQFYPHACHRCAGLLVNEWGYAGEQQATLVRCVQCGSRMDPVIRQHQRRRAGNNLHIGDPRHRYPVRTVMSEEPA